MELQRQISKFQMSINVLQWKEFTLKYLKVSQKKQKKSKKVKFITSQRDFYSELCGLIVMFWPLFFCSLSDGCHTDLVCQPACCYWCHPFSYCCGPFKISRNQKGSSIFPFWMTPSIINCNFSFPAGLTLTPRRRRWMGIRALTSFKLILSVFTPA